MSDDSSCIDYDDLEKIFSRIPQGGDSENSLFSKIMEKKLKVDKELENSLKKLNETFQYATENINVIPEGEFTFIGNENLSSQVLVRPVFIEKIEKALRGEL